MKKNLEILKGDLVPRDSGQHESAIVKAFESMNLLELEKLLDEEKEYDDRDKWSFMQVAQNILKRFHRQGDTFLTAYAGKCNSTDCKLGNRANGYLFQGNNSGKKVAFVFNNKTNFLVENICECINFSADNGKSAFFLDKDTI